MKYFKSLISAICLLSSGAVAQSEVKGIDYHTHIGSPEMGRYLGVMCGKFAECDAEEMAKGTSIKDLLPTLESSTFNRAIIMSTGYMAGMPEFKLDIETQKKLTRSENQYVADQVAMSDKFQAFFSVNPITDYAVEEAEYWMDKGGFSGMKLHMANSSVNFFDADHVKKIQTLFGAVDGSGMTFLIHLRNRNPEYGAKDVEVFINDILPHAPKSTIIIAHAVGWGGYDEPNDEALVYFINAMNEGRVEKDRTFIGVGAVVMEGSPEERITLFIEKFRSLDIDNWVFGSDWSPGLSKFGPVSYLAALKKAGLSDADADQLISNRLPFVK